MSTAAQAPGRFRDARIDLARGLTMLIIFVAHAPGNSWAEYIPARMGFSSGAEAFVLCSGLACGIAFGGAYRRSGWIEGTRRILRRIGQLWLAQIAAFAAFALLMLAIGMRLGTDAYMIRYSLGFPAAAPVDAALALATLRYVPDFFDILPLYIVLLAAAPAMVLLAGASGRLALGVSGALWLLVQAWPLNLPASPVSDRQWYFDPLAWQFLFFIGFGATAGWFRPPSPSRGRIALAAAVILACIPLTFWGAHQVLPALGDLYRAIYPNDAISTLHPLRLAHALILGWLFAALLAERRSSLAESNVLKPVLVVGQQSLSAFIAGIFLSALAGVALDLAGRGALTTAAVNLGGMALIVLVAYAARAAKSASRRPHPRTEEIPCPAQR